ncbi:MAG: TonB-dependent receptor, partial [Muribaculaceae bacterium]|nr:TonB-dependent receptor [Muribaculaceae bacterium]
FTPSSSWGINTSYGYTNATFTRYFNGISDYKGKHVPYSPTHTLSAQAFTNIGINAAKQQSLTLTATLNGAGKIYLNEDNTLTQPFYATLAASAKLNLARFSIEIWANNITNTKYNTFYFLSMQRQFLQRGAPQHMGITLQATL